MDEPLLRYGLAWAGTANPIAVAMPDGYWTPWHLAEEREAALRARVAELELDAKWRPIDTAPRDGSRLLLRSPKGRVADGEWSVQYGCWSWPYVMVEPTAWLPFGIVDRAVEGE